MSILQEFITRFQDKSFVLTQKSASLYHTIHSVVLYYIYLVYIMYQSSIKSQIACSNLKKEIDVEYQEQILFMEKRLQHVNDVSEVQFKKYYEKLEVFFELFK